MALAWLCWYVLVDLVRRALWTILVAGGLLMGKHRVTSSMSAGGVIPHQVECLAEELAQTRAALRCCAADLEKTSQQRHEWQILAQQQESELARTEAINGQLRTELAAARRSLMLLSQQHEEDQQVLRAEVLRLRDDQQRIRGA